MITPNHGLSGYVCGRALMPLLRRVSPLSERAMGWAFFLGAMLPDIDILTKVVGGRAAYFGPEFYAHRHASHSLLGGLVLALAAALPLLRPLTGIGPRQLVARGPWAGARYPALAGYAWLALCLWMGTALHLVGDFFTPGWPLPILWPHPERWGGLRHIGWFTPYLLWLFLATIALGWSLEYLRKARQDHGRVPAAGGRPALSFARPGWLRPEWAGAAAWALYTVATYRWVTFMMASRYESWDQWHTFQRTLLPEAMIVPVTDGVRGVWFWLTG